jgi:hypothetical protein
MAYDGATQSVVLFGGQGTGPGYLNDTWTWKGLWMQQHPSMSPPARYGAAEAYDPSTQSVILFGGVGDISTFQIGDLSDTWIWNGATWIKQHPAISPPPRHGASMAYDGTTGVLLLFGGDNGERAPNFLNDSWVWTGTTWSQRRFATAPPARVEATMAYDEAAGQLVLFGGSSGIALGDTWVWDGRDWAQQVPAQSPAPRFEASLAYDAANGRLLLFGGEGGFASPYARRNDTWAWNGRTWTELVQSTVPPARALASISRDAKAVVLFGGSGNAPKGVSGELNDTWTWDGSRWIAAPSP